MAPILAALTLLLASCGKREPAGAGALGADASLKQAATAMDRKDYARALILLQPALQSRPNDPLVLNLKGAILTKTKDYDGALACYEAALKSSPGFFAARYNIGALMALRQQWDPAIAYYKDLLRAQPNNELVQYKLLLLLLMRDQDAELQGRLFPPGIPSNTPAWYFAAAARACKEGQPREALKYIDVARSVFGDQIAIFKEELDESGLATAKK
jgi:tetratricopeptide (TPR) repeat protein